jgi:hypothetical protein
MRVVIAAGVILAVVLLVAWLARRARPSGAALTTDEEFARAGFRPVDEPTDDRRT